ncbi:hypothetical protein DCC85_18575 [Paenibacillus sp. CAA11]|uniref:pirin family protein n=1 Tax=Paenibacillus sp. CAA11 TaxID=1532905 RepID=UPI000D337DD4|nr:pirin family protein [Paenibacillus sp. CAA11]AWB45976.1 hypothetical protein DCC85_18575 [Paenibacillus sp. CAA11]
MIVVRTSEERHTLDHQGAVSQLSFSFAEYQDLGNEHFGCLLVHNDYSLPAGYTGKQQHVHDLIVVSIVLSGTLLIEEKDGLGYRKIAEGEIDVQHAGTGIDVSYSNASKSESVRYIQLWFLPAKSGEQPSSSVMKLQQEEQMNRLTAVVPEERHRPEEGLYPFSMYLPELDKASTVELSSSDKRIYIYLTGGAAEIQCDGESYMLEEGDAVRIQDAGGVRITGMSPDQPARMMIIELP